MTLHLVFDDIAPVPRELQSFVGVDRFGSLVFQRLSRLDAFRALAREAGAVLIHLSDEVQRSQLVADLAEQSLDSLYLYCPSFLLPVDAPDKIVTFLRQIQYTPSELYIPPRNPRDQRCWMLLRAHGLRSFLLKQQEGKTVDFFEAQRETMVDVRDRLHVVDVSDTRTLLDFLSGQFDARAFNAMEHDAYTVTKRSKDRAKMKRELNFYYWLPPIMQSFVVQPFELQDDGVSASYRMERLCVPDVALQWMNGAFQGHDFERFLEHLFYFVSIRSKRPSTPSAVRSVQDALYIDKLDSRIAMLKALPQYAELAPLLERACGGIDALVAQYKRLYEKIMRAAPAQQVLALGHGDLCFSNILYSKTDQYLKLIDPRGADSEDELYTDPYYDIAKLSHSILGSYDFINHDRFDINVDERLRLRLVFEGASPRWAGAMFLKHLERMGFDPELTRLFEASLFISMLPLHIDRPLKVLAFVLNAGLIVDNLSEARGMNA